MADNGSPDIKILLMPRGFAKLAMTLRSVSLPSPSLLVGHLHGE